MDVAVSCETEDFNERERKGGARKAGMSENVGVDLIQNSHVRTFFDY